MFDDAYLNLIFDVFTDVGTTIVQPIDMQRPMNVHLTTKQRDENC